MKSNSKIRVLVVQLSGAGDVIQSLMALRAAQQLYPQLEISVIVRDSLKPLCDSVAWIANCYGCPAEEWLEKISSDRSNLSDRIPEVALWLTKFVEKSWDIVLNWSYSDASSYLSALIPAKIKLGYTRSGEDTRLCSDGWSLYIQAIVQGGVHQNIHLTDILTTQLLTALQINFGDPGNGGEATVTARDFFSRQAARVHFSMDWRGPTRRWIAFQIGLERGTVWSDLHWAKLATLIIKNTADTGIVLIGPDSQKVRESKIMRYIEKSVDPNESKRIVSMIGLLDIDLWASVLGRVQWLFSGDSPAVHLASVLGTRVAYLGGKTQRWFEHGPYGNGHLVIESDGSMLNPQTVFDIWNPFVLNGQMPEPTDSVRAYRSRIRPSTDGGGVVYEPLTGYSLTINDWMALVMGQVARSWYCGWVPPVGHELKRETLSPLLIQNLRELNESVNTLVKVISQGVRISEQLAYKSRNLKSENLMSVNDRKRIEQLGENLTEIDQLLEKIVSVHPILKGFSQMAKVMMHNLRGNRIHEMSKESEESYRQILDGAKILQEWIEYTLRLAKPVALKLPDSQAART